jgi:hypothetical protein
MSRQSAMRSSVVFDTMHEGKRWRMPVDRLANCQ